MHRAPGAVPAAGFPERSASIGSSDSSRPYVMPPQLDEAGDRRTRSCWWLRPAPSHPTLSPVLWKQVFTAQPCLGHGLWKGILFSCCSHRPPAASRTLPLDFLSWGTGALRHPRGHPPPSARLCRPPTRTGPVPLPALAAETGHVWSLGSGHAPRPVGIFPSRRADSGFGRRLVSNLGLQNPSNPCLLARVLPQEHCCPETIPPP